MGETGNIIAYTDVCAILITHAQQSKTKYYIICTYLIKDRIYAAVGRNVGTPANTKSIDFIPGTLGLSAPVLVSLDLSSRSHQCCLAVPQQVHV